LLLSRSIGPIFEVLFQPSIVRRWVGVGLDVVDLVVYGGVLITFSDNGGRTSRTAAARRYWAAGALR
jgi:hypothetical protein